MLSKSPQGDFEKRLFKGSPGVNRSPDANSLDWHKLSGLKPPAQFKTMHSQSEFRETGASGIGLRHDKSEKSDDTNRMPEITPEELRTTLSALEDRMDRRAEKVERDSERRADAYRKEQEARDLLYAERFEGMSRRLEDRDKVIDAKLDSIVTKIGGVEFKVDGFESKITESVTEVRKSNRAALAGMLTIGVAIVLGVWGVNSTIISSASGIFTSGQESQKIQQGNAQMLKETQDLLLLIKQTQAAGPTESK
ncbi:hypothetical protein QN366_05010 [Pseudomonas sp. CCC3.2]|uniref:hypothetical protein n=1 Tax=unclassified Pseudomonas TaxID=196821 RepID=UPI002AB4BCCD|nr:MULTISPECIES: hypothetical protein [unclassified Pseudomonas]MDY7559926.1 hypothetical protein [Pseudomonas sp. AB6]MEA9994570.1 hypothetical protein [Pseudomonas sp. AA4]MEB0085715.1 hypothetical protein [Pseudomonas sp. RTI1]MEB0125960.1 hypothetical protein [Pseudomonas sp. CCC1.2]MEB0152764.1 hypothetical protein [Pseudomonas sp. CCC4.3]